MSFLIRYTICNSGNDVRWHVWLLSIVLPSDLVYWCNLDLKHWRPFAHIPSIRLRFVAVFLYPVPCSCVFFTLNVYFVPALFQTITLGATPAWGITDQDEAKIQIWILNKLTHEELNRQKKSNPCLRRTFLPRARSSSIIF